MFVTRLISGIVLVVIAVATIVPGGWPLYLLLLAISLIGLNEIYRAAGVEDQYVIDPSTQSGSGKGFGSPLAIAGYLGTIAYYVVMRLVPEGTYDLALITLCLAAVMAMYVFAWPRYKSEQAMAALFGIVYVPVMLSFIWRTRCLPGGEWTVWLIFLCSWGSDTCAYCVGMLIGKHKMAPRLSPKKSIEGAVGGVLGAAGFCALFGFAAHKAGGFSQMDKAPLWEFALIGAIGALISMVGDLGASAIKRNRGIKDYGKLIPGHGGILDRFDSVIFTSPIVWCLGRLLLFRG